MNHQLRNFSLVVALLVTKSSALHSQNAVLQPISTASGTTSGTKAAAGSPGERIAKDSAKATGRTTGDPLLSSGARNARPQITAIATSADKTAKAQFGIDRADRWGILQLHVSASTPLAEGAEKTTRVSVADLSDLQGVSSGEFGGTFTFWKAPSIAKLNRAVIVYKAAQQKIADELQRQIDEKMALKSSTIPIADETKLHNGNVATIDTAIAKVRLEIQKVLELSQKTATAVTGQKSLDSSHSNRAGLQVSRELELKRHADALASITTLYEKTDAHFDAEISQLKERQKPFVQEKAGKIREVLNSNPVAMRDPSFAALVADDLSLIEELTSSRSPFLVGASGSLGQKKYSYADSTTLAAGSQAINSNQVRFSAGVVWPFGFLSGFYSRQHSVSEKDQTQLCQPLKDHADIQQCANARIGAPSMQDKNLFGAEFRVPMGPSLMGALEVTRDKTNKTTAWQVPIYFMSDGKGALNGGIVVGGQTKKAGYTLKIFVGAVSLPTLK